jgi:acetolactate synthase-1/2/3 large subunit
LRVADYVTDRLVDAGVRHVFAVSGRGALFLTDAVARNQKLSYIAMHHEQAAGFAAVAYAQHNEVLGACMVSTGCAGTNAITPVLSAWQDGIPTIFISGQNTLRETTNYTQIPIRTYGQQEADIAKLVTPITKYSVMITDPNEIGIVMDTAIHHAISGRKGPVWIDIPLDIQSMQIDPTLLDRSNFKSESTSDLVLENQIEVLLREFGDAKRPVVLIGSGVRASGALETLARFVEKNPIPVTYTGSAPDTYGTINKWSIGSVGMMGCSRAGNFAVQNSDLLVVIGNRLSSMTTGPEFHSFAREAKVFVIDIDITEHLKESVTIDELINIDAKQFLEVLISKDLPKVDKSWLNQCLTWKEMFNSIEETFNRKDKVDLYQLTAIFSKKLPDNTVLVSDSGLIELILPTNFAFGRGIRCIHPSSQGSMGYAIPAAVGAHLASQEQVVVVVGDGSIMMNLQELQTIGHLRIPIKIFVVNNNAYAIIRKRQTELFRGRTIGTDSSNGISCPNFEDVAKTFSLKYRMIQNSDELSLQLDSVIREEGPMLCELIGYSDQDYIQMSQAVGANKRLVRRPLEDQWPFLDRKFFAQQMLISPIEEG